MCPKQLALITGQVKVRVGETALLFGQINQVDSISSVGVEVTAAEQDNTGAGANQVYITITLLLFVPPCVDKRHTLGR